MTGFRTTRANLASVGHVGRLVIKSLTDMSTGFDTTDSPVTMFTITGDVMLQVFGVVQTAITSTSNTGTLSLGNTAAILGFIGTSTVDGSQFVAGDIWNDTTPATDIAVISSDITVIGGGADIILTIATNNMTAGAMEMYCLWRPLSSDALVVAA